MKFLWILALLLVGCKKLPIMDTEVERDSTSTRPVERTVAIKGSTVSAEDVRSIMDQMLNEQADKTIMLPGTPGKTIYRTIKDDNGMMLRFMLDREGRFTAQCSKKDSLLRYLTNELEHWKHTTVTRTVYREKPSALTAAFKELPWYWSVGCALGVALLILIFGLRLIRN